MYHQNMPTFKLIVYKFKALIFAFGMLNVKVDQSITRVTSRCVEKLPETFSSFTSNQAWEMRLSSILKVGHITLEFLSMVQEP